MGPQLRRPIGFDQLQSELAETAKQARFGRRFRVSIDEALTEEHERNTRRYAAVTPQEAVPTFFFAEQTLWLPYRYRLGLYAHEIGHVLAHPDHNEDSADAHGMAALDLLIVYDHRWPGKGLQVAIY